MTIWKPTQKSFDNLIKSTNDKIIDSVVIDFKAELTEALLGTVPKDQNIYESHVADKIERQIAYDKKEKKKLTEEEIETVSEELIDKGWKGFHKDDESIFIYNYMILGNIKSNLQLLNNSGNIDKVTSFKKICDTCVKATPRRIRFYREKKLIVDPDANMERPVRASTAMGERTFISKSDLLDSGSQFSFRIRLIKNKNHLTPEVLVKCLKLGEYYGLGQWRGSGNYGSYKLIDVKVNLV